MPTSRVVLDTTQYVRVNVGQGAILMQSNRDTVRIALSAAKPALGNPVFHQLSDSDRPMKLPIIDTDVWALATTDTASLSVTEYPLG